MCRFILILILIYIFSSVLAFASCSKEGITIVYVNGIFTSEKSAKKDKESILTEFNRKSGRMDVKFITGYNPPHLAGFGDVVQVISQALGSSMSDFDLKTILMQIHSEVKTQKILLVGHSQGTFYTNEMYNYLTTHGVPKESIAVYNIATPASTVSGDGKYLTSGNDNLINTVREWTAATDAPQPLSANILIPLSSNDEEEFFRGHAFSREYLAKGSGVIISDINNLLNELGAQDDVEGESGGCYEAPTGTFSYKMQKFGFAVADPTALVVRDTVVITGKTIAAVGSLMVSGVVTAIDAISNSFSGTNLPELSSDEEDRVLNSPKTIFELELPPVPDSALPEERVILAVSNESAVEESAPEITQEEVVFEAGVAVNEEEIPEWQKMKVSIPYPGFGGDGGSSVALQSIVVEEDVVIDTILPIINDFTVSQCAYSLSSAGCLLISSNVTLSWKSPSTDISYYGVATNDVVVATTTATSTDLVIADGSIVALSVVAYDSSGNSATSSSQTVEVFSRPVVINEVAWAGTDASPSDEWIELYNPTSKDIDLSNWVLSSEDGAPYINLEGSISAGGHYLIERSDDDMSVSDITADLAVAFSGIGNSFGLSDNGEHLLLEYVSQNIGYATSTVDETPALSLCGNNNWCGGRSDLKTTMERIDSFVSGANELAWGSSLGEFILNGEDANNVAIKGTPRQRNSAPYLISQSGVLNEDKVLTKSGSPYLITKGGLTVATGVTLSVDSGVVVKFVVPNEPSLEVNGTLITNGTAGEPIVFTAFADDVYGGDMNGDADLTIPVPASWKQILFNPSSVNSSLSHTLVRYGGKWFDYMLMRGMVVVDEADVLFDNVVFEYGGKYGLNLSYSASEVTNSVFRFNNTDLDSAGVYVIGGAPTIENNIFEDNRRGLYVVGAPSCSVSSNTFTNNSTEAIDVMGAIGSFVSNTGSGNSLNAIVVSGNITNANVGTTTLAVNSIPYVIKGGVNVVASTTLAFSDGVTVKGYPNIGSSMGRLIIKSGGKLFHNGSSAGDVVFTSIHDDTVGGVVDNATTSPAYADWYGIEVEDGGVVNMSGFTVKYAGGSKNQSGDNKGGIKFVGNSATSTISNALFEDNYQFGIRLSEASVIVTNTAFNNHVEEKLGTASAIYSLESSALLQNIAFTNNELDIKSIGNSTISCVNCGTPIVDPIGLLD